MAAGEPRMLDSKPMKLDDALAIDNQRCTPCRLIGALPSSSHPPNPRLTYTGNTGSAAFIGLGGYTYFSGMSQLNQKEALIARSKTMWGIGARRLGIQGIAASLIGLGVYRFVATD